MGRIRLDLRSNNSTSTPPHHFLYEQPILRTLCHSISLVTGRSTCPLRRLRLNVRHTNETRRMIDQSELIWNAAHPPAPSFKKFNIDPSTPFFVILRTLCHSISLITGRPSCPLRELRLNVRHANETRRVIDKSMLFWNAANHLVSSFKQFNIDPSTPVFA